MTTLALSASLTLADVLGWIVAQLNTVPVERFAD